jgi:hypothetical protein
MTSSTCDSNEDDTVDAGDVSCTVLLAFGQDCADDQDTDNTQELISNGSFEESTDWAGTADNLFFTTAENHTGDRSLRFVAGNDNYAYQEITFPQNLTSAELTFYWKSVDPDPYTTLDPLDGDALQAVLCEPSDNCETFYGIGTILDDSQGDWQQATLTIPQEDLAVIAGKTINLTIFKQQDGQEPNTTFYIDDVSFQVSTSSLSHATTAASAAPVLQIGSRALQGSSVTLPVSLDNGGARVSSVAFSIDYDETRLTFDPTDADNDGVPDALRLIASNDFDLVATFDASDTDSEIDVFIGDIAPELAALPDGTILSVTLGLAGQPGGTAAVRVASEPAVSFGTTQGASIAGSGIDGTARLDLIDNSTTTLYLPRVQR